MCSLDPLYFLCKPASGVVLGGRREEGGWGWVVMMLFEDEVRPALLYKIGSASNRPVNQHIGTGYRGSLVFTG